MKKLDVALISTTIAGSLIILYLVFKKPVDKTIYKGYSMATSPFKYFSYSEFDSPDEIGSGKLHMNPAFIQKLDIARGKAGIPFKINSGYRTTTHNEEVGGVANSAHTLGLAADISTKTEEIKKKIARALYESGFVRLGFAKTFIHVDDDKSKPQVAFNYDNQHIYTYSELT